MGYGSVRRGCSCIAKNSVGEDVVEGLAKNKRPRYALSSEQKLEYSQRTLLTTARWRPGLLLFVVFAIDVNCDTRRISPLCKIIENAQIRTEKIEQNGCVIIEYNATNIFFESAATSASVSSVLHTSINPGIQEMDTISALTCPNAFKNHKAL